MIDWVSGFSQNLAGGLVASLCIYIVYSFLVNSHIKLYAEETDDGWRIVNTGDYKVIITSIVTKSSSEKLDISLREGKAVEFDSKLYKNGAMVRYKRSFWVANRKTLGFGEYEGDHIANEWGIELYDFIEKIRLFAMLRAIYRIGWVLRNSKDNSFVVEVMVDHKSMTTQLYEGDRYRKGKYTVYAPIIDIGADYSQLAYSIVAHNVNSNPIKKAPNKHRLSGLTQASSIQVWHIKVSRNELKSIKRYMRSRKFLSGALAVRRKSSPKRFRERVEEWTGKISFSRAINYDSMVTLLENNDYHQKEIVLRMSDKDPSFTIVLPKIKKDSTGFLIRDKHISRDYWLYIGNDGVVLLKINEDYYKIFAISDLERLRLIKLIKRTRFRRFLH